MADCALWNKRIPHSITTQNALRNHGSQGRFAFSTVGIIPRRVSIGTGRGALGVHQAEVQRVLGVRLRNLQAYAGLAVQNDGAGEVQRGLFGRFRGMVTVTSTAIWRIVSTRRIFFSACSSRTL